MRRTNLTATLCAHLLRCRSLHALRSAAAHTGRPSSREPDLPSQGFSPPQTRVFRRPEARGVMVSPRAIVSLAGPCRTSLRAPDLPRPIPRGKPLGSVRHTTQRVGDCSRRPPPLDENDLTDPPGGGQPPSGSAIASNLFMRTCVTMKPLCAGLQDLWRTRIPSWIQGGVTVRSRNFAEGPCGDRVERRSAVEKPAGSLPVRPRMIVGQWFASSESDNHCRTVCCVRQVGP